MAYRVQIEVQACTVLWSAWTIYGIQYHLIYYTKFSAYPSIEFLESMFREPIRDSARTSGVLYNARQHANVISAKWRSN
ncbi:hypothetical protein CPC08DRAFT_704377 [Agrocybe pediades]|nr:hypothetical protein CPC08DRAFT_704377 [Agrocybe pediades]